MQYTVIINGRSYDLPKKTMNVVEEMDRCAKIDSVKNIGIREKFNQLYKFIKSLVGDDNAKEILGSENLDEVDLSDVTLTFRKIMDAYQKPVSDYNMENARQALANLPIDKITNFANAANTIGVLDKQ